MAEHEQDPSAPAEESALITREKTPDVVLPPYVLAYSSRLKELRKHRYWNQSHMASEEVDNMDPSCYSDFECGSSFPSVYRAVSLVHTYHISLDYLFGLSGKKALYPPRTSGTLPVTADERKRGICGSRLRCLRLKNHLTQNKLGRMTFVYPGAVSKIERGERGIPHPQYPLFAIVLRTSLDYLLGFTDYDSMAEQQ